MPALLKSFHYARSVMGRAILEAGQFAHIPEHQVWETLDSAGEGCCSKVTVRLEHGGVARETGYYALDTLDLFAARFGTLCPVCLGVVGLEPRGSVWAPDYMPTFLSYDGACQFPIYYIEDFPEWYDRCSIGRSRVIGSAHARCELIRRVSDWLSTDPNDDDLKAVSYFFRRRSPGGWRWYLEQVGKAPRPSLRFNPRTPRDREQYLDMRFISDAREVSL